MTVWSRRMRYYRKKAVQRKNTLSVNEVFKFFAAAGVTEFAESFCFDLADTFAGYVEFLADFFKSSGASVIKTETET
jgi:hypothetical protein